jgi:hypothetical protein
MDWAPKETNELNQDFLRDFLRLRSRLISLTGLLALAHWGAASGVQAGVAYQAMPIQQQEDSLTSDEQFPESRWGSAPMRARKTETPSESQNQESATRQPASATAHDAGRSSHGDMTRGWETVDREVPSRSSSREPASDLPDAVQNAPRKAGVQEVAVIAGDLGFFPKKVFVNRDMPVRLFVTGASRKNLCVLIDAFQVRRQVKSNKVEEITFTPGSAGTFRIHCPINGIEGHLVVREITQTIARAANPE